MSHCLDRQSLDIFQLKKNRYINIVQIQLTYSIDSYKYFVFDALILKKRNRIIIK